MQNQIIEGFRLSPQQKRLWSLQQDGFAYRTQCAILLEGKLKGEVLKEALQRVVNRHEILRTTFHRRSGIKIPIQVIADSSTPSWHNVNLSDWDLSEQEARIEELFQEEKRFIFNFEQGPLLRSSLLTLSAHQHILLVSLPSLCADGWTLKNLVQAISHAYAVCLKSEELSDEPIQYIQFSEWQNKILEGEDAETGRAYWRQQDLWAQHPLTIPFEGKPCGQKRFEPDVHALRIYPDVVAKSEAIATLHNITIAEFLFASWQTLLWRLTGQPEIVISTVYSGRQYEELHGVLGLLAKWLPIRCTFNKYLKFPEVFSQISEAIRNTHKWQEYFLWKESTGSDGNIVKFPISFEFEEWPDNNCAGGVSFSVYNQYICFDQFKVKLTCVRREESLIAEFHYDTNLFCVEDIKRLARQFQTLVESAANNPEATVNELEILKRSDRQKLLIDFNNTQTDFPKDKCIHHLFEEQAERTPNNIAVVFEDQQLTYAELNARANQLAHHLQRLGVQPEVSVALCVKRSLEMVIGLLGILKAGALCRMHRD
ncbi:MAG: AMP-binding protein [Nostoc indistinguendum CM1-VF10]|jgi:hypothetical protein|nr:AMP-binding protein [Nostoc indistinguendum CM1-VF10]